MPSLATLSGEPLPDGYDAVEAFATNDRPYGWSVEEDPQFTPALLILRRFYEVSTGTTGRRERRRWRNSRPTYATTGCRYRDALHAEIA